MGRAKEQGLKFSLQDVFEHQTIETLARVTTRDEGKAHAITVPFELVGEDTRKLLPAGIEDAYPLAWLQLGMLFHSAYAPDSGVYHDVISIACTCRTMRRSSSRRFTTSRSATTCCEPQ